MKYPLYEVSRSACRKAALIIATSQSEALERAKVVWAAKDIPPLREGEMVSIKPHGTVDYIPSMPTDHIEGV